MMAPRPDVSDQRKQQILDAAMRVFARKGFHNARMDDIAQEADLSKGTLYWYFRSKDAIIEALVDKMFQWELHTLGQLAADASRSVPERLRQLAHNIVQSLEFWGQTMPLLYEFYALATRPGPVRDVLQRYYDRYHATLTQMIAEGVRRGELQPLDADLIAVTMIAQFEGLMLLWVIAPATFDFHTHWLPMADRLVQSLEA